MKPRPAAAADAEVLARWFLELRGSASRIAELAIKSASVDASATVRSYLGNEQLRTALGASPEINDVPGSGHSYSEWLNALWGRRCAVYLDAVARGLERSTKIDPDSAIADSVEALNKEIQKLRAQSTRERRDGDTLARSVELKHGVTNFHRTYLDPVLFSALLALTSLDDPSWAKNAELGVTTDSARARLQDELIRVIAREIEVYTERGQVKSGLLADDSTLWWGVYELVSRTKQNFVMGAGPDLVFAGLTGAAELVLRLSEWTRAELLFPSFRMSLTEATPEIYGPFRTQMLVVQNCSALCELNWPSETRARVIHSLRETLSALVGSAHAEWMRVDDLRSHAYFVGLGLDVVSRLVLQDESAADAVAAVKDNQRRYGEIGAFGSNELRKLLNIREAKWRTFVEVNSHWIREENRESLFVDMTAVPREYRDVLEAFETARIQKTISETLANRQLKRRRTN